MTKKPVPKETGSIKHGRSAPIGRRGDHFFAGVSAGLASFLSAQAALSVLHALAALQQQQQQQALASLLSHLAEAGVVSPAAKLSEAKAREMRANRVFFMGMEERENGPAAPVSARLFAKPAPQRSPRKANNAMGSVRPCTSIYPVGGGALRETGSQ